VVRYITEAVNVYSMSIVAHPVPSSGYQRILFLGFFPQIMFVSPGMKREMAYA
jgi:hypothetical protein